MSREIKFRVWDGERMYLWNTLLGNDFTTEQMFSPDTPTWEVMQFTGLLDKNGKEIYEGDIVKTNNEVLFEIKIPNIYYSLADGAWTSEGDFEIIGNIYENSELLNNI